MLRHVSVKITGRVQGVFFRATTKDVAESFKLKGFVRNEPDGSVYVEAEGDAAEVDKFLNWCKKGPPRAVVTDVAVTDGTTRGYADFSIRRS